ncbi:hypothetical protein [Rhizobium leguminosarum]|uniref:hypothetical protein n=1 Tax=Rhizobium leguminosarum TaxID=384 RepID=UPI002E0E86F3|nr:hypothetical protein U8Q02_42380 [Rhizobium leguminosarum]
MTIAIETISEIRRFNAAGLVEAEARLNSLAIGIATLSDLGDLLFDDKYTETAFSGVSIPVDVFDMKTGKYDLGRTIVDALDERTVRQLLGDEAVWPWLSFVFAASIFPEKKGVAYVGKLSRHLITAVGGRSAKASHRHLVRGAVNAVFRFGEQARGIMAGPSEHTTYEEQIMSRTERTQLAGSTEFVRLVNVLYFDPAKGKHKPNAAKGKTGSMMRLIDLVGQLETNYDVAAMSADEMISILPEREFARYLKAA